MDTIRLTASGCYGPSQAALCCKLRRVSREQRWARHGRALAAAGLAMCMLPAYAADRETPPNEVEPAFRSEPAGETAPNWRNILIDSDRNVTLRSSPFGGLRDPRRPGLLESPLYRGLYIPLASTWRAAFDTRVSPALEGPHQYTLSTQIQKLLPGDWIAGVGFHRNEYLRQESQTRTFSLERYWGNLGAGYTLFSGKPEASGASAPAHRFHLSYQYGNLNSFGLAYSTGREFDGAPATGLFTNDVRHWTLAGRHWFARNWAVTYEALNERYGNLYRRDGLRLGLRYRF